MTRETHGDDSISGDDLVPCLLLTGWTKIKFDRLGAFAGNDKLQQGLERLRFAAFHLYRYYLRIMLNHKVKCGIGGLSLAKPIVKCLPIHRATRVAKMLSDKFFS
jgi:hypothetical protein